MVPVVIDGVIGFHALFPLYGVLSADDGLGILLYLSSKSLKMLVFYDSGVRNSSIGIVDLGKTLIVGCVLDFVLKTDGTVFQFAEAVVVELVYLACEYNFIKLRVENGELLFFRSSKKSTFTMVSEPSNSPSISLLYPPMGTP